MTAFKYPLATATWDQAEYDAIQKVVASGMFTMGAQVQAFEKDFAKYIGSAHAVMVNSGSSANLLMVAALFYIKKNRLVPGDEVIVPATTSPGRLFRRPFCCRQFGRALFCWKWP